MSKFTRDLIGKFFLQNYEILEYWQTKNVPKNLIVCIFTDSKFKSIIPKLPF